MKGLMTAVTAVTTMGLACALLCGVTSSAARAGDVPALPQVKVGNKVKCPTVSSKGPVVYGIGSSTMGGSLGKILRKEIEPWGAKVRIWGKASSGLSRPDFHDWPERVPEIVKKYTPDFFVISLGTNDGQPLVHGAGRSRAWANLYTDDFERIYAERVDRVLEEASGPDKTRPVIWLGPTAHPSKKFNRRMRFLRDIIKTRVAAFGGQARFIDGYKATLDERTGKPKTLVTTGTGKRKKAVGGDGIHMTSNGTRWLLAEPILAHLSHCFPKAGK